MPRAVRPQVVQRHIAGGKDIPTGDGNAHAGKALHIFQRAAAGIVGEKQDPPPFCLRRLNKFGGALQQTVAQINGAVQIQHEQPDLLQQRAILLHFASSTGLTEEISS